MSVSDSRKMWQQFKRAHPTFAASRDAKLDLGPKLDRVAKLSSSWIGKQQEANKLVPELVKAVNEVQAAIAEYEKVVDQAGRKDFEKVQREVNAIARGIKIVKDANAMFRAQAGMVTDAFG